MSLAQRVPRPLTTDLSRGFHAAGDKRVANTKLGALGAHGGFTKTIPLLAGSPAINAGGKAGCPPIDQRGHHRPHNGPCDIGSYER